MSHNEWNDVIEHMQNTKSAPTDERVIMVRKVLKHENNPRWCKSNKTRSIKCWPNQNLHVVLNAPHARFTLTLSKSEIVGTVAVTATGRWYNSIRKQLRHLDLGGPLRYPVLTNILKNMIGIEDSLAQADLWKADYL